MLIKATKNGIKGHGSNIQSMFYCEWETFGPKQNKKKTFV